MSDALPSPPKRRSRFRSLLLYGAVALVVVITGLFLARRQIGDRLVREIEKQRAHPDVDQHEREQRPGVRQRLGVPPPARRTPAHLGKAVAEEMVRLMGKLNELDDAAIIKFAGAAYLMSTRPREDGLVFTLQGWTTPRIAYAFDPVSRKLTDLKLGESSPGDYRGIVATDTEAVSTDGTKVPMTMPPLAFSPASTSSTTLRG